MAGHCHGPNGILSLSSGESGGGSEFDSTGFVSARFFDQCPLFAPDGTPVGGIAGLFWGLWDLKKRQIRVLHANSFIEDPTRIYRAVRFAVRLNFQLEVQTEEYIRYAIASGIYDKLHHEKPQAPALTTRLRAELKYLLTAKYWKPALQLLDDLGALKCIHKIWL